MAEIIREEDGTIKLTVTIPLTEVTKAKALIVEEFVKNATLPGFRKGKAPKKLAEKNIDKGKLTEETLKKLLPEHYFSAIKEHKLNPIINPKISVEAIDEGKDWKFTALTCEAPKIDLEGYKESVKSLTAKTKIVIPGKEQKPVPLEEIIAEVLKSVKATIPSVLIEQQVDRQLSQTLDEIKKLGLTLDQYLASTGKTAQDLRQDYQLKAQNDLKLEFALEKIAQEEKITVEEKEIDEAITKAPNETEKKSLEGNKYFLASILRQQKTLDFLKGL